MFTTCTRGKKSSNKDHISGLNSTCWPSQIQWLVTKDHQKSDIYHIEPQKTPLPFWPPFEDAPIRQCCRLSTGRCRPCAVPMQKWTPLQGVNRLGGWIPHVFFFWLLSFSPYDLGKWSNLANIFWNGLKQCWTILNWFHTYFESWQPSHWRMSKLSSYSLFIYAIQI